MKMKSFFLPALALALFAACSGEEALTSENKVQQTTQNDAVTFDAYLNRTVTRAGQTGAMDLAKLQATDKGFGVFAYYSDGDLYSENAIPDFMYNQQVKHNGTAWEYSPLKYWPNEFGSSAVSTGVDRVTFFAYAPYVSVDPATGQLTNAYNDNPSDASTSTETGITALTRNGKTGDPYVRYVSAFEPDRCVDLLYGVAAENFKSYVGELDGANNIKAGDPFINVAKPEIGAKLKFNFKHALAKLTVNVDADVDIVRHDNSDALDDDNTRIWIRSITFDGIAQRGYLNLNNGMWYEVINGNKISHANVTIHDGLRDGAEPLATDEYETPTGLNPDLVQSVSYTTTLDEGSTFPYKTVTTASVPGVTNEYQDLFGGNGSILVIPANEQLKVTIVYDVETADATLPNYLSDGVTKGSTVENRITKAITLGGSPLKLDAGKAYTLNLHLGMTSVKFDAQVSNWDNGDTADNTWLPENAKVVAAGSTTTYNAPADGGDFNIKITGLKPTSTKTESGTATPTWTADNPAVSGILSFTLPKNTTVKAVDKTAILTETGDGSSVTTINIKQAPAPLGLGVQAFDASAKTITLKKEATGDWADITNATSTYDTDKKRVQVKKNGTELVGDTSLGDGKFTFAPATGVIALNEAPKAGDVFTITVKAGDAEAETITVRVGGPVLPSAQQNIEYGETYTRLPEFIGPATPAYTWSIGSGSAATVDADGEVTSAAIGDATIKLETDDIAPADGWVYDTSDKTYPVTVTATAGTISFEEPLPANKSYDQGKTAGSEVRTKAAVLRNSKGTELTIGAANGGTIGYSLTATKVSDSSSATSLFAVSATGDVTVATGETLADNTAYTITVTATVTPPSPVNATYSVTTATYTITVDTTPNPGP